MLRTRFCERFGVSAPIVVAPMDGDVVMYGQALEQIFGGWNRIAECEIS